MTKKERGLDFLRLASKGEASEAFRLYVDEKFKHHNAYFKGDRQSLMIAMEEGAKKNPSKIFEVQRALEDGDLVAVHSRVRQNSEDAGVAVVHIFRFEGERIVELWDFAQTVPLETVNENGMF